MSEVVCARRAHAVCRLCGLPVCLGWLSVPVDGRSTCVFRFTEGGLKRVKSAPFNNSINHKTAILPLYKKRSAVVAHGQNCAVALPSFLLCCSHFDQTYQ